MLAGDWKDQIGAGWGNTSEVDPARRRTACREQSNRPNQSANCVPDMARNMSSYAMYHPHQVSAFLNILVKF